MAVVKSKEEYERERRELLGDVPLGDKSKEERCKRCGAKLAVLTLRGEKVCAFCMAPIAWKR